MHSSEYINALILRDLQADPTLIERELRCSDKKFTSLRAGAKASWWGTSPLEEFDHKHWGGEVSVRHLNGVLRERVNALALANKELRGFPYPTSHAFPSSLRAIMMLRQATIVQSAVRSSAPAQADAKHA